MYQENPDHGVESQEPISEPQTPISDALQPLATFIILNQTDHKLQSLTAGPGVRGNGQCSPSSIGDIYPSESAQWAVIIKDSEQPRSHVNTQMAWLIVTKTRLPDCPTVGLEWSCFEDGEQEVQGEVNDIDEDAYEGDVEEGFDERGIPKYVFTVRNRN
ncbi:hypothetical protein TWF225_005201 [Orbilia oligospora]|uniref:Uncharacterized protein n=1 Tax=Orbilia oligospora TaxID=2813651 RepID=A0A7C8KS01_ORBOL|nr:hypothetical protein TWF103_008679 [Orbilia oligospora]KAF3105424.1 hypothetical protein TWF102_002342 [Orbilia oligospora]KAF3115016.1 hypothetical protein TWF706_007146 [Orbilia oligospora]KAF3133451.1 hypothetical protein TWF703_006990 [Orbilia oligospora]KAF3150144.1 hypothetical protein TWF594_010029 [Orbilia oligospora]